MATKKAEEAPVRAILVEMKVGDMMDFPARRTSVVRSTASILSFELERNYKTNTFRDKKIVRVQRIA